MECPSNPWRVQNNAVFARIDAFLERCHDVLDLTTTIAQFQKVGTTIVDRSPRTRLARGFGLAKTTTSPTFDSVASGTHCATHNSELILERAGACVGMHHFPACTQLANLEVGGTKGKVLTTSVAQIYVDFGHAVDSVKNVDYDVMDLDAAEAFEDCYQTFRSGIGLRPRSSIQHFLWTILQCSCGTL